MHPVEHYTLKAIEEIVFHTEHLILYNYSKSTHYISQSDEEYHQMMLNKPIGMHTKSDKEKFHETSSRCCAPDLMDWRNFGFVTKVH